MVADGLMVEGLLCLTVLGFVAAVTVYIIASAESPKKAPATMPEFRIVSLCNECMTLVEPGEGYQLFDEDLQTVGVLCPKHGLEVIEWNKRNGD